MSYSDVLVIGAGLSGLMAANHLRNNGVTTVVIDKGKSVGGRMATRRIHDGKADHGAQFFTARSKEMKSFISSWERAGMVKEWTRGFHQMSESGDISLQEDGYPRYYPLNGMNGLTKEIAKPLSVTLNKEVTSFEYNQDEWIIYCSDSSSLRAKGLISTVPIPQLLTWMNTRVLQENVLDQLRKIAYEPCLTVLLVLDRPSEIPKNGGIQGEGIVSFIGDNQQKGISKSPIVTVHASGSWSELHYQDGDEEIIAELTREVQPVLGKAKIVEAQVKRWRYAKPKNLHPELILATTTPGLLAFAGDCFLEGKVEGAILSGLEAGKWMENKLTT